MKKFLLVLLLLILFSFSLNVFSASLPVFSLGSPSGSKSEIGIHGGFICFVFGNYIATEGSVYPDVSKCNPFYNYLDYWDSDSTYLNTYTGGNNDAVRLANFVNPSNSSESIYYVHVPASNCYDYCYVYKVNFADLKYSSSNLLTIRRSDFSPSTNFQSIALRTENQQLFAYVLSDSSGTYFLTKIKLHSYASSSLTSPDSSEFYYTINCNEIVYKRWLTVPIDSPGIYKSIVFDSSTGLLWAATTNSAKFALINPNDGVIVGFVTVDSAYAWSAVYDNFPRFHVANQKLYTVRDKSNVYQFSYANINSQLTGLINYTADESQFYCGMQSSPLAQPAIDSQAPFASITGVDGTQEIPVSHDFVDLFCSDETMCSASIKYSFVASSNTSCSQIEIDYLESVNATLSADKKTASYSLDVTQEHDGQKICIFVKDTANNFDTEISDELHIGTTAKISISSPTEVFVKHGSSFNVTYSLTSPAIGTATYNVFAIPSTLSEAGNICSSNADPDGPTLFQCIIISTATEGLYSLKAKVTDSAGTASDTKQNAVKVDLTQPVISNETPTGASTNPISNLTPAISASYSDPVSNSVSSGINSATAKIYLDSVDKTSSAIISATGISFTPTTNLVSGSGAKGNHSVKVEVSDKAGNPATKTWSFNVNQAPTAVIAKPSSNSAAIGLIELDATGSTDLDSLDNSSLTYSWEITKPDSTKENKTGLTSSFNATIEGTCSIKLTVNDGVLSNSTTKSILVSNTSPSISNLQATPNKGLNPVQANLTAQASDPDNAISELTFELFIDNQKIENPPIAISNPTEKSSAISISQTFINDHTTNANPTPADATKSFNIILKATDPQAHSGLGSTNISVTNNPPVQSVLQNSISLFEGQSINIQASSNDPDKDNITDTFMLNNKTFTLTELSSLQSGSYSLVFVSSDGFSTVTKLITLTVAKAPEVDYLIKSISLPELIPVDQSMEIKVIVERKNGLSLSNSTALELKILDGKTRRILNPETKRKISFDSDGIKEETFSFNLAQIGAKENQSVLVKVELSKPETEIYAERILQNNQTKEYVPVTSPTRSVVPDNNLFFLPLIAFAVLVLLKKKKNN